MRWPRERERERERESEREGGRERGKEGGRWREKNDGLSLAYLCSNWREE